MQEEKKQKEKRKKEKEQKEEKYIKKRYNLFLKNIIFYKKNYIFKLLCI
jgi:hypothetical protein